MFKLMLRDLSTGGVIRQERDVNELGQFVRKRPQGPRRGSAPTTMESAFEDTKPYVLTDLGKQFVHYTMSEAVTRIDDRQYAPRLRLGRRETGIFYFSGRLARAWSSRIFSCRGSFLWTKNN